MLLWRYQQIFVQSFRYEFSVCSWRHHFTKRGSLLSVHDRITSLRGDPCAHQTSLSCHLLLKCLYQPQNVTCHVFVCYGYRFCLFLRFWYLILFRQGGIFGFHFITQEFVHILLFRSRQSRYFTVTVKPCHLELWWVS
jgi:hypothetical protein